ncbi:bifunctional hydroxymethylpyrimidine kinase/phosphomethylpyrimidine kinase [Methylocella silvestris]|uniref:hydroxymethylpyrimidine kinase n=1 Tax=Methylocella silvestris TaxID=199596 RepID=A0A2J7TFH0_METSI|nr:bifunctional hydroxymethylpyrimidine kinase/phosphomethylpyrimidine kinase [Methylocella silvestris]PNG25483.1 bifunctional hydroxymethylpyrimidine kinase/phosphomethylpyrimidine kinase [Methylocella silvestris]
MTPNILSIAGSDPSGGAGIQADLKTFSALGCYGMAAITALTAQNTRGVRAVHVPPADFVAAQIDAIFDDIAVAAVKIGMLGSAAVVEAVADRLAFYKPPAIVLDPVLVATSGDALASEGVEQAIVARLFPLASLVTPNLSEARRLSDAPRPLGPAQMREAADRLVRLGAKAVLIKGGDAGGETSEDFFLDGATEEILSAPRVKTRNTHGTGCTLSSAIAAFLGRGLPLLDAVAAAKAYLTGALGAAGALNVGTGEGHGPTHHFFALWPKA